MQLELDLRGRLRNFGLPAYRALVPVFEAVVNSLQAIDETSRNTGAITIEILRGTQHGFSFPNDDTRAPVQGFRIRDNGVGFNDANFRSFCTSDSTYKVGGRGVGRFTWLKAFDSVHIDSRFRALDGSLKRRAFTFTSEGIRDEAEPVVTEGTEETTVTLDGVGARYAAEIPKRASTIVQRIVDHCLLAIRASTKRVSMHVEDGEDVVDVRSEVDRVLETAQTDTLEYLGHPFGLTHLRVSSPDVAAHRMAFLANGRVVRSEPLNNQIPHLRAKLENGAEGPFWWVTLVESSVLDECVNSERDGFEFPDEAEPMFPDRLTLSGLRGAVIPVVQERLQPHTAPMRERAKEQVRQFVENRAPEYRHVVALRGEAVAALPPDLSEERLDAELHRIAYSVDVELREKGREILASASPLDSSQFDEFISEANAAGKANLAKYVVQRRIILALLQKSLERGQDGRYQLEEAVHRIVFPLRATSDEVPYEKQNLWIVDERLAYHAYLASDKELRSVDPVSVDAQQRPDLVIFNRPFAFTEQTPYNTIVIIEFKRPARDDYDDNKNPITQVYDYVRRIRSGREHDRAGRPMNVPAHVPFYCYIICDITPRLKTEAENATFTETPDRRGYFGFNPMLSTYTEIVSFEKLIDDAGKRNRILFDKLNLPRL